MNVPKNITKANIYKNKIILIKKVIHQKIIKNNRKIKIRED